MPSHPATSLARLALVALLVVTTSGCQLRLGVDLAVDAAGGGRLAVSLAADRGLRRRAAEAGVDPLGELAEAGARLGADGWTVVDERLADGGRQVTLTTSFADPAELERASTRLAEALSAPEVRLLEPLRLALEPRRLAVTGGAGLVPTAVVAEHGLRPAEAVRLVEREDAVAYRVRVTLPGEVLETTATGRDGPTLVWSVAPGQRVDIVAVGARPRPLPWALAAAGAAVLLALALAVLWRRRLRRRPSPVRP